MLTELYIEALLVDEELADWVWELWSAGLIPADVACLRWAAIVTGDGESQGTLGTTAMGRP